MVSRTSVETVEDKCGLVQVVLEEEEVEVVHWEVEVGHLEEEEEEHLLGVEEHTERTMTSGFQRSDICSSINVDLCDQVSGATGQGRKGGPQQFHSVVRYRDL